MQRFSQPLRRQLTLSNGQESLTFTVQPLPLLFASRLDVALPVLDGDSPAANHRLRLRAVIFAAEGIRRTEELPPAPSIDAGEQAWASHAEELCQLFTGAGLHDAHINELCSTTLDLSAMKVGGKTALQQALDEAGNG